MTKPMAAKAISNPVKRTSKARVRKTWVVGSSGGADVLVLVAIVVVVVNVVVPKVVLCTSDG